MILPSPAILGYSYGISELALLIFKRSRTDEGPVDSGSLKTLWIVIILSIVASGAVAVALPPLRLPRAVYPCGVALFAAGLALRWYAILYLGRFFTVNVAIQEGHRVIDSGPYRFIRHPSYAGALLAFVGYGLCLLNAVALAVLMIPITGAFLNRIRIEEAVLAESLRQPYETYRSRTKRLVPFIY